MTNTLNGTGDVVDVPSLAKASPEELALLEQTTERERAWYADAKRYETNDDVMNAVIDGELVLVEGDANFAPIGRLRNPELHWQFSPYLRGASLACLQEIGRAWRTELQTQGLDDPQLRLAVTSMVRSEAKQAVIVSDPTKFASPDSMHCVGAAFDIDASAYYYQADDGRLLSVAHPGRNKTAVQKIGQVIGSLSETTYTLPEAGRPYDPRITDALLAVANRLHDAGAVSRILEFVGTENQCVHITPHPTGSNR